MTSAIPGATDYLVGLAKKAVTGVSGAVVADGWTDQESGTMFGIGTGAPPFFEADQQSTTEGQPEWASLGAMHVQEDFTIPCYIYVGIGGTDTAQPRLTAFGIWDTFFGLFRADISLGGVLAGRDAEIVALSSTGPRSALEAEGGRFCLIRFGVHCQNLT